jgi:hypothetical protein
MHYMLYASFCIGLTSSHTLLQVLYSWFVMLKLRQNKNRNRKSQIYQVKCQTIFLSRSEGKVLNFVFWLTDGQVDLIEVIDWLKGQNFNHLSLLSSILNEGIFCMKEKLFYVKMLLHQSIQSVKSFVLVENTTFLILPEFLRIWKEEYARSWGKNLSLIWVYICHLYPLAIRFYGPLPLQL